MWMITSRGKTIRGPSASDLVGALTAMSPDDNVVALRDLCHFVYVTRLAARRFAVWVRDGTLERQVRIDHESAQEVAATLVAFATHPSFTREIVDAGMRRAAA